MRYILNSAVITTPGVYEYRLVNAETAAEWLRKGEFLSTVGYAETAEALEAITRVTIPINRQTIQMAVGDEALVFRLNLPAGTPRPAPSEKGKLTIAFLQSHSEVGILTRRE